MTSSSTQLGNITLQDLEQFVRDYGSSLTRSVRYRFSFFSPEDVDDLIQDTFLKALTEGDKFDASKGSLHTWMTFQAYDKAWKLARERKKLDDRALTDYDSLAEEGLPPALRPTIQEVLQQLTPLLERLPKRKAHIIQLRYYEGLPVKDIAEHLGITENAVRSHISQALKQLRRLYDQSK